MCQDQDRRVHRTESLLRSSHSPKTQRLVMSKYNNWSVETKDEVPLLPREDWRTHGGWGTVQASKQGCLPTHEYNHPSTIKDKMLTNNSVLHSTSCLKKSNFFFSFQDYVPASVRLNSMFLTNKLEHMHWLKCHRNSFTRQQV